MPTLADVLAVLDGAYDPSWAEDWDVVGLVCGSPEQEVARVHVAVDPVAAVVAEALDLGADLLLTHHPLFLRGVHGVAETTPAGRVVSSLVRAGCALVSAHTNADVARPGVNDALLAALGVEGPSEVLVAGTADPIDALHVHVPQASRAELFDALTAAGAGHLGDYDRCGFWFSGTGTFRPLAGARPAVGTIGIGEVVAEDRLEIVLPRHRRAAVLAALRATHPYEEPSFAVWPLEVPADRGLGRVGDLAEPVSIEAFAERVAAALPATAAGVRWSGSGTVQRIAVCGGSGSDLTTAAQRAGADVLVTADTRHHTGLDAVLPIIDVSHWASEWPWCAQAADLLSGALGVTASVSTIVTDPWTGHVSSGGSP